MEGGYGGGRHGEGEHEEEEHGKGSVRTTRGC